jgi:hypothetical protein
MDGVNMTEPKNWTTEYLQLIEDCEKRDHRLSAWDVDFLSSIKDRLIDKRPLTEKQINMLDSIWERATKNG